jgi:mannose-6-phosphate isomerase-like protein (cupin superfamily)
MPQPPSPSPPPVGHRSPQPDATAPDGSEIRLLADERHQASRASLVEVTLAPGQVSRPVWHRTVEEIWYILEGRGRVWRCSPDADPSAVAPVPVGPGDALTIPTGWRFQFSAEGDVPLRFLCYTAPPWPGDGEAQPAEHSGLGEGTV